MKKKESQIYYLSSIKILCILVHKYASEAMVNNLNRKTILSEDQFIEIK